MEKIKHRRGRGRALRAVMAGHCDLRASDLIAEQLGRFV